MEASRIAKTPDDEFPGLFCLRARQTYEKFTEADHAGLKEYVKAQHNYLRRLQVPGMPIDNGIDRSGLANSPDLFLTEEQMPHGFRRPECEDVKDILIQLE